jgi:hypothetical protein
MKAKTILERLIDDALVERYMYRGQERAEKQKKRGIGYTINKLSEDDKNYWEP